LAITAPCPAVTQLSTIRSMSAEAIGSTLPPRTRIISRGLLATIVSFVKVTAWPRNSGANA
jgi:hypothetical protein